MVNSNKQQQIKPKRAIRRWLLRLGVFLVCILIVVSPHAINVADAIINNTPIPDYTSPAGGVPVVDTGLNISEKLKAAAEAIEKQLDKAFGIAVANGLQMASRMAAKDIAVKLAEGGSGLRSLTDSRTLETIGQDISNAAAGEFIGSFSQAFFGEASFLCNPDPKLQLAVQIGVLGAEDPKPKCDWREVQKSYKALAAQDQTEWLKRLSASFSPTQSDAGAMLFAINRLSDYKAEARKTNFDPLKIDFGLKIHDALDSAGLIIKPSKTLELELENGFFKQPGDTKNTIDGWALAEGAILAPFVQQFSNTLVSELMTRWLKSLWGVKTPCDIARSIKSPGKGPDVRFTGSLLCASGDINDYIDEGQGSGYGGSYSSGRNASQTYASLLKPKIEIGGEYDMLGEMIICPDSNPGINNCVMDQEFGHAVLNQLTLKSAIEEYGYIDGSAPFGYTSPQTGTEPNYTQGIGISNIQKMRRARIVPVGWELAAEIIRREAVKTQLNTVYSLSGLMQEFTSAGFNNICDGFDAGFETDNSTNGVSLKSHLIDQNDSLFCGLVDPNWVLKAPQQRCVAEAPGELLLGGGLRQTYCAKTEDCILEEADGGCRAWGQCDREKNIWWFDGQECPNYYDTCQTFQAGSSDTELSVLKDSLSYAGCSANNDGCSAYAWNKTAPTGDWLGDYYQHKDVLGLVDNETDQASDYLYFFDNEAASCTDAAVGCSEFIRSFPGSGTNLVRNGSFEEYRAHADGSLANIYGWEYLLPGGVTVSTDDFWLDATAVKLSNNTLIGAKAPVGSAVDSRTFTLSFATKNCNEQSLIAFGSTSNTGTIDLINDAIGAYRTELANLLAPGTDINTWRANDMLNWGRYSLVYAFPNDVSDAAIGFIFMAKNDGCLLDGVQIAEGGSNVDGYAKYGSNNQTYLRQAPSYLGCNGSQYQPAECNDYAPVCSAQDVGCQEYTALLDGTVIPGQVVPNDSCPAACVGYSTYKQSATNFYSQKFPLYFIASSGEKCNAQNAGCQAFTNLDTVPAGGESVENYSFLRRCESSVLQTTGYCSNSLGQQCTSNNDCAAGSVCNFSVSPDCAPFYTWEGSEATGYRLQLFSLKENPGNLSQPFVIKQFSYINPDANDPNYNIYQVGYNGDPYSCEPFYGQNLGDAWYNSQITPNCRQFYSAGGQISYRLMTDTVLCSESCHPYRLDGGAGRDTVTGVVNTDCKNSGGLYNQCRLVAVVNGLPTNTVVPIPAQLCAAANGVSYNGLCYNLKDETDCVNVASGYAGIVATQWDDFSGQCRYLGEPESSTACNKPGCREYKGNYAAAGTTIFEDVFDGETVGPATATWNIYEHTGNANYAGYVVGENYSVGGHSYRSRSTIGGDPIARWLGDGSDSDPALVSANTFYTLSFWARNTTPVTVNIFFQKDVTTGPGDSFATNAALSTNWQYYRFGPVQLKDVASLLVFDTAGSGILYVDNVKLEVANDTQFLIADSWVTPAACDQNQSGAAAPQFMLGCAAYKNNSNVIQYLRSFNRLCQPGSIGCEALIDTHNSSSPWYQQYWRECKLTSACTNTNGCACEDNGVVCQVLNGEQTCSYVLTKTQAEALPSVPFPNGVTASEPYKLSTVPVPADNFVYLVNKPEYRCNAADKGCQALGQVPYSNYLEQSTLANIGKDITFAATDESTRYLKNTPDQYDTTACQRSELWCDAFSSDNTDFPVLYFRNPGGQGCEYRNNAAGIPGWFVKNPTVTGSDTPCSIWDPLRVNFYAAKYCTPEASSCTQFVDPAGSSQNGDNRYFYLDDASIRRDECRTGASLKEGCVLFTNYNKVNWQQYIGQSELTLQGEFSTSNATATYAKSEAANFTPVSPVNCEQPVGSDSAYCPTATNNANDLIKVRRDRVCAEWVNCEQKQTWTDPATGQKSEVCFTTNSCTKFTSINDPTQPLYYCATTDESQRCRLDDDCNQSTGCNCALPGNPTVCTVRYNERECTPAVENPIGFPYNAITYRDGQADPGNIENPADGLPMPIVTPAMPCNRPGVPCVNNINGNEGMFSIAQDVTTYGVSEDEVEQNPLVLNKYLNRNMGWMNGYEYTGLSIPYLRPVWSLDEVAVGKCVSTTPPSGTPVTVAPANIGSVYVGGIAGATAISGCISDGDCASNQKCDFSTTSYHLGYRLINTNTQQITRQPIGVGVGNVERKKACRAYPELDSPFSRAVAGNTIFAGVNICGENPDGSEKEYCDCHYQKLISNGGTAYITFQGANMSDDVAMTGGGIIVTQCNNGIDDDEDGRTDLRDPDCGGSSLDNSEQEEESTSTDQSSPCFGRKCVCSEVDGTTGLKVGDLCNFDDDCEAETEEPRYTGETTTGGDNSTVMYDCGDDDEDTNCYTPSDNDVCVPPQEIQSLLGWKGYCLEGVRNINVENNPERKACLTWMPMDLLRGEGNAFLADPGADYSEIEGLNSNDLWYCLRERGNAPYKQTTSSHTDDHVEDLEGCDHDHQVLICPDDESKIYDWEEYRPVSHTEQSCGDYGAVNDVIVETTELEQHCVLGDIGEFDPASLACSLPDNDNDGQREPGHYEWQEVPGPPIDQTWVKDGDVRVYARTNTDDTPRSTKCGVEFTLESATRLANAPMDGIEAIVFEEQGCLMGVATSPFGHEGAAPAAIFISNATSAVVFIPDKNKREMYTPFNDLEDTAVNNYNCDEESARIFTGWETCWPVAYNDADDPLFDLWRNYAISYKDNDADDIADIMVFNSEIALSNGHANVTPENMPITAQNALKIIVSGSNNSSEGGVFNKFKVAVGNSHETDSGGGFPSVCPGTNEEYHGRNIDGSIYLRPIVYYNEQCTAFAKTLINERSSGFEYNAAPRTNTIFNKTAITVLGIAFDNYTYGSAQLSMTSSTITDKLTDARYIYNPIVANEFPFAGTPYSCSSAEGNESFCGPQVTTITPGYIGAEVSEYRKLNDYDFTSDDHWPTSPDVREKIGELFAKSFAVYKWTMVGEFGDFSRPEDNSMFDYRKRDGVAPTIKPVLTGIEAGAVTEGVGEGPSINFRSYGNGQQPLVVASGYTQVAIRFFGYNANGQQMPIRNIGIDWDGAGFGGSGDRYISVTNGRDAFANRKSACGNANYGDQGNACKAEYYEFIGAYAFDPSSTDTYYEHCGIQIANQDDPNYVWNGYNGPCNRYRPAVQLIDNWGVCADGISSCGSDGNMACLFSNDDDNQCAINGWVAGGELIILGDNPVAP